MEGGLRVITARIALLAICRGENQMRANLSTAPWILVMFLSSYPLSSSSLASANTFFISGERSVGCTTAHLSRSSSSQPLQERCFLSNKKVIASLYPCSQSLSVLATLGGQPANTPLTRKGIQAGSEGLMVAMPANGETVMVVLGRPRWVGVAANSIAD